MEHSRGDKKKKFILQNKWLAQVLCDLTHVITSTRAVLPDEINLIRTMSTINKIKKFKNILCKHQH